MSSSDQQAVPLKPWSASSARVASRHLATVPNFAGNARLGWGDVPCRTPFTATWRKRQPSGSTSHQRSPSFRAWEKPVALSFLPISPPYGLSFDGVPGLKSRRCLRIRVGYIDGLPVLRHAFTFRGISALLA